MESHTLTWVCHTVSSMKLGSKFSVWMCLDTERFAYREDLEKEWEFIAELFG